MAKTYEKIGDILKEIDTKTIESEYDLKYLRSQKQFLINEINDLQLKKTEIQVLIDKAVELKVTE
jgi:hypothetical protein